MLSLYRKLAALGFLTGAMFVARSTDVGADHWYDCNQQEIECEENPYLEGTFWKGEPYGIDDCYVEWEFRCDYEGGSGFYSWCGFHTAAYPQCAS
jgi:hypothetical protein